MDFMHPGCLGERSEYMKMYARPMQVGQRVTADALQVGQALRAQRHFRAVVDTYLLRRTKALIADQLPRKRDYVVFCDLSDLQRRAYRRVLESPDGQLLVRCAEPCDCGSNRARCHCCHQHAPREDGGVLWPQYHTCKCDDEYDRAFNPKGCK